MNTPQKIIKEIRPHPLAYLFYYFAGGFVTVSIFWTNKYNFLIGILIIIFTEIFRRAQTFRILETGVERGFKFLINLKIFADFDKIQDMSVEQGIIDRVLGIGKLKINTAGSPNSEIVFSGIKNPEEIEDLIRKKLKK